MLKLLCIFLSISTAIGAIGIARDGQESNFSSQALFRVPDSPIDIILERRNIHLFLAEYERTLVLRVNGMEVLRHEAAVDTGGYSHMNIFQVSSDQYFLIGELSSDSFFLDLSRTSLSRVTGERRRASGRFVGSFDRDEKGWRFIPVRERGMQKSLIDQQGGILDMSALLVPNDHRQAPCGCPRC